MKIHDSKGKLYYICPFIEKMRALIHENNIPKDTIFEISRHMDSIMDIAIALRGKGDCPTLYAEKIYKPYNFKALLGNIRLGIKSGNLTEKKLDEIVEMYF